MNKQNRRMPPVYDDEARNTEPDPEDDESASPALLDEGSDEAWGWEGWGEERE